MQAFSPFGRSVADLILICLSHILPSWHGEGMVSQLLRCRADPSVRYAFCDKEEEKNKLEKKPMGDDCAKVGQMKGTVIGGGGFGGYGGMPAWPAAGSAEEAAAEAAFRAMLPRGATEIGSSTGGGIYTAAIPSSSASADVDEDKSTKGEVDTTSTCAGESKTLPNPSLMLGGGLDLNLLFNNFHMSYLVWIVYRIVKDMRFEGAKWRKDRYVASVGGESLVELTPGEFASNCGHCGHEVDLLLQFDPCGHFHCEDCVWRELTTKLEFQCPTCFCHYTGDEVFKIGESLFNGLSPGEFKAASLENYMLLGEEKMQKKIKNVRLTQFMALES